MTVNYLHFLCCFCNKKTLSQIRANEPAYAWERIRRIDYFPRFLTLSTLFVVLLGRVGNELSPRQMRPSLTFKDFHSRNLNDLLCNEMHEKNLRYFENRDFGRLNPWRNRRRAAKLATCNIRQLITQTFRDGILCKNGIGNLSPKTEPITTMLLLINYNN